MSVQRAFEGWFITSISTPTSWVIVTVPDITRAMAHEQDATFLLVPAQSTSTILHTVKTPRHKTVPEKDPLRNLQVVLYKGASG